MRISRIPLLVLCLAILSLTTAGHIPSANSDKSLHSTSPAKYLSAPPSSPNATIEVAPNITDISRSMKQITVTVWLNNTPEVPQFNAITVSLEYNYQVLQLQYDHPVPQSGTLDFSSNVFAQSSLSHNVAFDCLDGIPAPGYTTQQCSGTDPKQGKLTFGETLFGGSLPAGTQGNIFILTFNVNTAAPSLTYIQITQAVLGFGATQIPVTLENGLYTSLACGITCLPPAPTFTWSPVKPKQGATTIFNASASKPTSGAAITDYFWNFGDTASLKPYRDSGTNSTVTYIYSISGTFPVTLTITDSYGVTASISFTIVVINANVDMGIESIDVEPGSIGLNPGIVFNITATLKNYGGLRENTSMTLTITIDNKVTVLGTLNVTNMRPQSVQSLSRKWDSSPYPPNVYRVDADTPLLVNETAADHNPNHRSFWIQLIPVQPAGGLSLLSTAGIAIVVVGAGGYGVSFLRKRNVIPDDKL